MHLKGCLTMTVFYIRIPWFHVKQSMSGKRRTASPVAFLCFCMYCTGTDLSVSVFFSVPLVRVFVVQIWVKLLVLVSFVALRTLNFLVYWLCRKWNIKLYCAHTVADFKGYRNCEACGMQNYISVRLKKRVQGLIVIDMTDEDWWGLLNLKSGCSPPMFWNKHDKTVKTNLTEMLKNKALYYN